MAIGRRGRYNRRKRYGLAKLPMGNWAGAVRPFKQSKDHYGFTVVHTDAGTGDRVIARVYESHDAGYPRKSTGIPTRIDPKRVWYLQRIEPRTARVYGGTIATLRYLADQADQRRLVDYRGHGGKQRRCRGDPGLEEIRELRGCPGRLLSASTSRPPPKAPCLDRGRQRTPHRPVAAQRDFQTGLEPAFAVRHALVIRD